MYQNQKIGKFIVTLRERKGWTQTELARAIDTSQSAIARMEKGEQNFTVDLLIRLGHALDHDIIRIGEKAMNFEIQGGKQLSGRIQTNTSKNGAVALLCASVINHGKTTLKRVPKIEEVFRIVEVLQSIGMSVRWKGDDVELRRSEELKLAELATGSATRTRSVILLLGALAGQVDSFSMPIPGGCKLGSRTIRPHTLVGEDFGLSIKNVGDELHINTKRLSASDIVLYESGDTVTENALLLAAQKDGTSTISMASSNYQVQELCYFLQKLGVRIEGVGTHRLRVTGLGAIKKNISITLAEDPIESMLFIALAATTRSELVVERCPIEFLELELKKLSMMGLHYESSDEYLAENGRTRLVDLHLYPSDLHALGEKIYGRPFPGINIDNLPFFVPIATQAKGRTLVHDWVYENRALYYTEFQKLGAEVVLADAHRVYVEGGQELRATELVCPPALRPAAIIMIGMLAAKGRSVLRNVYSINRGYANLVERLQSIGADIRILVD